MTELSEPTYLDETDLQVRRLLAVFASDGAANVPRHLCAVRKLVVSRRHPLRKFERIRRKGIHEVQRE